MDDGHLDRDIHGWLEGDHLWTLSSQGDDGWYLHKPGQKPTDGVYIGFAAALRLLAKAGNEAAKRQDEDDGKTKVAP